MRAEPETADRHRRTLTYADSTASVSELSEGEFVIEIDVRSRRAQTTGRRSVEPSRRISTGKSAKPKDMHPAVKTSF